MKDFLRTSPLLQLSWVIALSVLLPLGLGIWLDRYFHTAPLFILIGALVGIIAGTVGAVRIVGRIIDRLGEAGEEAKTEASQPERGKEDRA